MTLEQHLIALPIFAAAGILLPAAIHHLTRALHRLINRHTNPKDQP